MVFALKKKIVIIGYRNKNQRRNRRLNNFKKARKKKEKTKKQKAKKKKGKKKGMILKVLKIYLALL